MGLVGRADRDEDASDEEDEDEDEAAGPGSRDCMISFQRFVMMRQYGANAS